ncbi:zinc finger CW-type PWWP domain protein 2 [Sceloporus undulatus]|uniref:zinc finger CW-type PWWP domain protein 2 n=1 Tax=Sceloporus undulatus TaxID=8520 RepID=UPI001C4D40EF|nr:zinc finger CW-type PWWP domain protein 2 [Sceloporus undulatus]
MDSETNSNFYIGKVWIQCENTSCLKWRWLKHEDATHIDLNAPWYCCMNTDPQFNKCSVSEEYSPDESQCQKLGLKYMYSKFPLGSLVLVKTQMTRWPGIICPDPDNGEYVTYNLDGAVENHHVEFLGKCHSRIWAAIKNIEYYPASFKADILKWKQAWYESALEEANQLLGCSVQQRLAMCYLSKNGRVNNKRAQTKTGTVTCRRMVRICRKQSSSRNGKQRKKRMLTCSLDIADSEDILSMENPVLAETEIILKDLDQILKHVADSSKPSFKSLVDGEDNNLREKVSNCCTEFTEKRPVESNTQEDCVIIDGKALKAGECIQSITDRFKEIDSLMAEFQDSL